MNAPSWTTVLLAVAALGGGLLAFRQQADLAQLRGEASALAGARATTATPVTRVTAPAEGGLNEAEKLELLRLRGEVTRLRARLKELSGIRVENEKLRAQLNAARAGGTPAGLPEGYTRRRDAQFAGYGSPEATLQSMLWAIEHQDTNVLFAAFDPENSRRMREAMTGDGADEFWKQARVVPGWRVVEKQQLVPDGVILKVEIMPGEAPQDMRLRLFGNEWKLAE
jgi:hypothetical protein